MKYDSHAAVIVLIMALITMLLRFLPFLIFRNEEKTPKWVMYLGDVLPQAIIGMLVIYCLRAVNFTVSPFGLPEIIACAAVAVLQIWRNQSTLSILGGTAVYMILVQAVFV